MQTMEIPCRKVEAAAAAAIAVLASSLETYWSLLLRPKSVCTTTHGLLDEWSQHYSIPLYYRGESVSSSPRWRKYSAAVSGQPP